MPHRLLSSDHVSRCGAARLPLPPKDSEWRVCPASGDDLFEILCLARWRFCTPMKISQGEKPVYLMCYAPQEDGSSLHLEGAARQAVISRLEAMA